MVVAGVALIVISLAADALSLGGHPGLGWKQVAGAALGVVVVLAGVRAVRTRGSGA
jgi:hypothetical protein